VTDIDGRVDMWRRNIGCGLLVASVAVSVQGGWPVEAQLARALEPTPLEIAALQPGARTVWSRFVGRLDGGSASAIVTAIAVDSPWPNPATTRGVRIELRHEGMRPDCDLKYTEWSILCAREHAAVFIEEDRLEAFRAAVLAGRAEIHAGHPMGVTHIYSGRAGAGILIGGYCLYGPQLADLASLLAGSLEQLKSAPR
jgi:hypothetical protein